MDFRIKLADRIIGITSIHDEVYKLCEGYYADGESNSVFSATNAAAKTEDFHINITRSDIDYEREKSIREAIAEGLPIQDYPDSYLENLAVYRQIALGMLAYDTYLMHGAVIGVGDKAFLFTAHSGVGKTTHIKLWLENIPGAYIINGDKPLLRYFDGGFEVCGTPWAGKEGMQKNTIVPLKAVCLLERGEANSIEQISFMDCYPVLLQQSYRPSDPEKMQKTMELVSLLGKTVPLYRLKCNMDSKAAEVAYKGMMEA